MHLMVNVSITRQIHRNCIVEMDTINLVFLCSVSQRAHSAHLDVAFSVGGIHPNDFLSLT